MGGGGGALFSVNPAAVKRNKVIGELVQGKELADRLRVLLMRHFGGDGSTSAAAAEEEELAVKILRSFTETLSVLGGGCVETALSAWEVVVVKEEEVCCDDDSTVSCGRRLEDSGESKKRLPGPKGKRGCYKRKMNSETWRIVTPTIEDGYAWRKYGQKGILKTKYPRSYFRCTHKYEQGCKATKHVQKMEGDSIPQMYEIIYIGNHTCSNQMPPLTAPPPPLIISTYKDNVISDNGAWSSCSMFSSSSPPTSTVVVVKQECSVKEESGGGGRGSRGGGDVGDDLSENLSSSLHDHQLEYPAMWEDLLPLDHHDFFLASSSS